MITLSNGAEVHMAFVLPKSPGLKPHGLVLARTDRDWVTWDIYWDGYVSTDGEVWEAEQGHYFQANTPESTTTARDKAEYDYGQRLRHFLPMQASEGVRFS